MPDAWVKSAADSPDDVAPLRSYKSGRGGVAARLAHNALHHLPFGVAVVGRDLKLLLWNEHAARIFGQPPLLAEERPMLSDILAGVPNLNRPQQDGITEFVATHVATGDRTEPDSCLRISLGRGRRLAIQVHGIGQHRWMLVLDDGKMATLAVTPGPMQDGSMAWLDALTGLGNRRYLTQLLRDLPDAASSPSTQALLMIDLDGFKAVNDSYGQPVGDALLCLVGQRLRRETRDDDALVRLGGDKFAILIANGEDGEALATRLVDVLSRPFLVEGHLATIGASVGIARHPQHGPSGEDLSRHAELALYEAKNAGRRTWRLYDPSADDRALARRDLETGLRKAMALDELSLVYLPRSDIATQAVSGFQASPRWTHPELGEVSRELFILMAEEHGCVAGVGEWVLRNACVQAMRWPRPLTIAVSLSASQLRDRAELFSSIQAALRASALPPGRLELDITERSLLSPEIQVLPLLHRFRAAGIRVGLDHVGHRLASLSHLRSFPFSTIKIGQGVIAAMQTDRQAAATIRAIAAAGAELGVPVTAEGVGTAECAASLKALGCTVIQGFPFSRPLAADEIEAFLGRCGSIPTAAREPLAS